MYLLHLQVDCVTTGIIGLLLHQIVLQLCVLEKNITIGWPKALQRNFEQFIKGRSLIVAITFYVIDVIKIS